MFLKSADSTLIASRRVVNPGLMSINPSRLFPEAVTFNMARLCGTKLSFPRRGLVIKHVETTAS